MNPDSPLFSIIVPIFMVEDYLEECIASLIGQTFTDFELILVDDGSRDASPLICDEFATTDARVRVVHQANRGLSAARNTGISMARGQYVLFVDGDDHVDRRALEWLSSETIFAADVIAFGGLRICGGHETQMREWLWECRSELMSGEELLRRELSTQRGVMAACLNAYRRRLILDNQLWFVIGRLHEDEQWTPRVLATARNAKICPRSIYRYRVRPGSIMQARDKTTNSQHLMITIAELKSFYNAVPSESLRRVGLSHLVGVYLQAMLMGSRSHARRLASVDRRLLLRRSRGVRQRLQAGLACIAPGVYFELARAVRRTRAR